MPLALICEFNFLPIRYLHPSWVERLEHADLVARLRDCRSAERFLSRHLFEAFSLDSTPCFDFASDAGRVALLDGEAFGRLCLYAGAFRHADPIRRVLLRDEQAALRGALGPDAYLFALKRAPWLGACHLPAVSWDHPDGDIGQRVLSDGVRYVAAWLAEAPIQVLQRLLLKVPADWSDWLRDGWRSGQQEGRAPNTGILRKLVKEAAPQWQALFN